MKKLFFPVLVVLGVLLLMGWVLVSDMRVTRPPTPPAGSPIT